MRNLFILSAVFFVVVTGAAAGVVAMALTSPHLLASSGYSDSSNSRLTRE